MVPVDLYDYFERTEIHTVSYRGSQSGTDDRHCDMTVGVLQPTAAVLKVDIYLVDHLENLISVCQTIRHHLRQLYS
jgi:hypothetical protein